MEKKKQIRTEYFDFAHPLVRSRFQRRRLCHRSSPGFTVCLLFTTHEQCRSQLLFQPFESKVKVTQFYSLYIGIIFLYIELCARHSLLTSRPS